MKRFLSLFLIVVISVPLLCPIIAKADEVVYLAGNTELGAVDINNLKVIYRVELDAGSVYHTFIGRDTSCSVDADDGVISLDKIDSGLYFVPGLCLSSLGGRLRRVEASGDDTFANRDSYTQVSNFIGEHSNMDGLDKTVLWFMHFRNNSDRKGGLSESIVEFISTKSDACKSLSPVLKNTPDAEVYYKNDYFRNDSGTVVADSYGRLISGILGNVDENGVMDDGCVVAVTLDEIKSNDFNSIRAELISYIISYELNSIQPANTGEGTNNEIAIALKDMRPLFKAMGSNSDIVNSDSFIANIRSSYTEFNGVSDDDLKSWLTEALMSDDQVQEHETEEMITTEYAEAQWVAHIDKLNEEAENVGNDEKAKVELQYQRTCALALGKASGLWPSGSSLSRQHVGDTQVDEYIKQGKWKKAANELISSSSLYVSDNNDNTLVGLQRNYHILSLMYLFANQRKDDNGHYPLSNNEVEMLKKKRKTIFKNIKEVDSNVGPVNAQGIMEDIANTLPQTTDTANWTERAKTWQQRMEYMLNAAYGASNQNRAFDLDDILVKYYDGGLPQGFLQSVYPMSSGMSWAYHDEGDVLKKCAIKNQEAYDYLIYTMFETPFIIHDVINIKKTQLGSAGDSIPSSNIATMRNKVQPVVDLLNGLTETYTVDMDAKIVEYLRSWRYDDEYATLDEIYTAFEKSDLLSETGDGTIERNPDNPLWMFFGVDNKRLSNEVQIGVEYSALYVPMRTNVYDAYTLATQDADFLQNFHYKYGFMRKALYLDTNVDAAMDLYTTGARGERRVCTLRDFLEREGDTVLYLDDNFYNANKLAEKLDMAYNRLDNVDQETDPRPWYERLWSSITDWFTIDIYEMTKTAELTKYSEKLHRALENDTYSDEAAEEAASEEVDNSNKDQRVLTSLAIKQNLEPSYETTDVDGNDVIQYRDYNELMSFAVVSGIYRNDDLFKIAQSAKCYEAVYIASPDVACLEKATAEDKGSLLNYALQRNLKSAMPIGFAYNIDMDSPLYMDVYGNILTESGVVVIPAASNMTLFKGFYHKYMYAMGLFTAYGKDWSIPDDFANVEEYLNEAGFQKGENTDSYVIASRIIGDNDVDYARLTTGDTSVNTQIIRYMKKLMRSDDDPCYQFYKFAGINLEVMRGAPIDSIDKNFEGLNIDHRISETGLVAAAKFEELDEALTNVNGNAMLSVPNLAFVGGFEYIVLFAFKFVLVVAIVIMLVNVFIDILRGMLSMKTFTHCVMIVVITILSVLTVPLVFQTTYYEANRALLQNETTRIALLNEEKRQQGVEVGVYTVKEPKEDTELLIKLEDIDIPWWDLFYKATVNDIIDQMDELMADYTQEALTSQMPGVTVMNNGVYVTVNDLFDTADVELDLASKQLYVRSDPDCPASFFTPYYTILHSLVYNINQYNISNNWYSYTTKTQRGGRLKSQGLCTAYFTSTDFMESEDDILYMLEAHRQTPSLVRSCPLSEEMLRAAGKSLWTNQNLKDKEYTDRTAILTKEAQKFVARYKDLLGRVSDETFLKVMALHLAMKHNDIFGVNAANCYEVYKLSQNDLTRLSIANDYKVMINSTLNYPRFLYEVGGTTAIFAGAFKGLIEWLGSYVKPLVTAAIFIIIFVSMFVFKVVKRKEDVGYYGYIITTILLCAVNIFHALLLKLSMYLPYLNLSPTVCLLLESIIEVIYLGILGWVLYVSLKDWRNLGAEHYLITFDKLMTKVHPNKDKSEPSSFRDNLPKNNWDYYHRLVNQRKERE